MSRVFGVMVRDEDGKCPYSITTEGREVEVFGIGKNNDTFKVRLLEGSKTIFDVWKRHVKITKGKYIPYVNRIL